MKKVLQYAFITGLLISFYPSTMAQTPRLKVADKSSVKSTSVVIPVQPNIPEKTVPKTIPTAKGNKRIGNHLLSATIPDGSISKELTEPVTRGTLNTSPGDQTIIPDETSNLTNEIAKDQPLYPDLKVTATKEEPYINTMQSREKQPQQMIRRERQQPKDELNSTQIANTVTISPLKRKYLEGIVKDLETEIKQHTNDPGVDIQSKKKELQDLKKLLSE